MASRQAKYAIQGHWYKDRGIRTWVWSARVPYGTWSSFDTWAEAADWLRLRHRVRKAKGLR